MITFEQLGLSQESLASLAAVGFTEPTEIQGKAIGIVAARKDLIASAQTGSGKTAAYVLPILDILRSEERAAKPKTKALVIVPTRELALQVCGEFDRFSSQSVKTVTLYGGTGYRKQVQALHRGADVIVATPGRLLDCLNRNFASLAKVQVVVLDEADRLLDMGFMPQVRAVIARAPEQRQTVMFSATIDARMKKIAEEFLREPQVVSANQKKIEPSSIEQQFHFIKEAEKEAKLLELLQTLEEGASALVFTKTRVKASLLACRLKDKSIAAEEIHGDISQSQRVRTLTRFRSGEFNILIATDVAARGLDIPAISHVVNYDLPMAAEDYVHRIGRTGRAGKSGIAHSFVSKDQRHLMNAIQRVLKNSGSEDGEQDFADPTKAEFVQKRSSKAFDYAQRILSNGNRPLDLKGSDRRRGDHRSGNRYGVGGRQGSSQRNRHEHGGMSRSREDDHKNTSQGSRYRDSSLEGERSRTQGSGFGVNGNQPLQKKRKGEAVQNQKKHDSKDKQDPKDILKDILTDAELTMYYASAGASKRKFSRANHKPQSANASSSKPRSSWGAKKTAHGDFRKTTTHGSQKRSNSKSR